MPLTPEEKRRIEEEEEFRAQARLRAGKRANPPPIGCCSGILIIIALVWFFSALAAPNLEKAKSKATEAENQRAPQAENESLKYQPTQEELKDIIETRICPIAELNIRKGPGTTFEPDESGTLFQNEKLFVLEEKNGWLRFRVTMNDVGWEGWVSKNYTIPINITIDGYDSSAGVLVDEINLWDNYSTRSKVVAKVKHGEKVELIKISGEGALVKTQKGVEGWLTAKYFIKQLKEASWFPEP